MVVFSLLGALALTVASAQEFDDEWDVPKPDWHMTKDEFFAEPPTKNRVKKFVRSLEWQDKLMTQNWFAMMKFRREQIGKEEHRRNKRDFRDAINMIHKTAKHRAYCHMVEEKIEKMEEWGKIVEAPKDCDFYLSDAWYRTEAYEKLTSMWMGVGVMGMVAAEGEDAPQLTELPFQYKTSEEQEKMKGDVQKLFSSMKDQVLTKDQDITLAIPFAGSDTGPGKRLRRRLQWSRMLVNSGFGLPVLGHMHLRLTVAVNDGCPSFSVNLYALRRWYNNILSGNLCQVSVGWWRVSITLAFGSGSNCGGAGGCWVSQGNRCAADAELCNADPPAQSQHGLAIYMTVDLPCRPSGWSYTCSDWSHNFYCNRHLDYDIDFLCGVGR